MATINFFIQSESTPAGIYIRLREGRAVDAKAKTKYVVNPSDWSDSKGKPRNSNDASFKKLDEDLISLKDKLLKHYNKSVDSQAINTQWLKDFINPPQNDGEVPAKLIAYIDYYTKHKKNEIGSSTFKRNSVYKHLIERFEKEAQREYFIKDVNADFKLRFEAYCVENKYAHNTIARTVKFIKTICYHALNNGIETHFQLKSIAVKLKKVEKIYLSEKEIKAIEEKIFDVDYLENARDWLIISCETGQRVSDFLRFAKEMIRYEKNRKGIRKPLVEFTQVKTGKNMALPLSKRVLEILKKRKGEFPRQISDQRYNEYIKEVCKRAELTEKVRGSKLNSETSRKEAGIYPKYELVTSHIGRRSFATNYYGKIPTALLMAATGHSTEASFLEYIGKSKTEQAKELADYI